MSDPEDTFGFNATVNRINNTNTEYSKNYEFVLGNNGEYYINLPNDGTFALSEIDPEGYNVTIKINNEDIINASGCSIDLNKDYGNNIEITVTNKKDVIIDTGIMLDSLPYISILAIVIIGIGAFFINKKRKINDI